MSTIDQRIVDMRFNNTQFESGIQTSLKSLDDLKRGLNFSGVSKSLSGIEQSAKGFTLSHLSDGVTSLTNNFSALGVMGVTALANITNSAMNAGKQFVKSLTIDPIKSGLSEYETKINAITTILTNTESKGTTLDQVNAALNDLNLYADKTIYNFAEMTRNIGLFTAAGVGLEESATAIKGISNLAAGSGSNAHQAATAMTQLSQALGTGALKLQDYNSVVNAGMGGERFKKTIIETSKELMKTDSAYREMFDYMAERSDEELLTGFRESLKDGWVTTEVMMKAFQKFADDESLTKAATQVKTFTQLMDTMKESVQSGWAQTWEAIIGDRDEAAELFTMLNDGFNSIIEPSANARLAMVQFWKDNGGRQAAIDGMTAALKTLSSILEPVSKAFREVFPAVTGQNLLDLTLKFKDLMTSFEVSEGTLDKIGRTFKGVFSALDIGRKIVLNIANALGELIKFIFPASDGLLSFTATIGDYITKLNESFTSTDVLIKAFSGFKDVFKPIGDAVTRALDNIKTAIANFTGIDLSAIDNFTSRITISFKPLTDISTFISGVFTGLGKVISKVMPLFANLGSVASTAFKNLSEGISAAVGNANFDKLISLFNSGMLAAILLKLKDFIGSLSDLSENAGGFLEGITGILDGVKGSLEAYQNSLKAKTLMSIATAIGVLTASLYVLSGIDSEKLAVALTAVAAMLAELFGSMAIFDKIIAGAGFKSMPRITASMIALASAILILSAAVEKLSGLSYDELVRGLAGVAGLTGTLVMAAKALSSGSGALIKGSTGYVIFASAILILAEAVEKIGSLNTEELIRGLVGVGVVMGELVLFMKATDVNKMSMTSSTGLVILGAALNVFAEAVSKFADMDTEGMIQGLIATGVVLGELAIFVRATGNAKGIVATSTGMIALAGAMLIFSKAVQELGSMPLEDLIKGLAGMAGSLGIIAIAMGAMPPNMMANGAALLAVSVAIVALSKAMQTMGGMSWEEMAKGLITLAGSLTIIATAMTFMTTALPGAAALLTISVALNLLGAALKTMGGMSWQEIATGLIVLAGGLAVIGGATVILGPLAPAMLALSGSIALLGVACLGVGAGILAFSTGLAALAVSGTAGAAALVAVVTSIMSLIPTIFEELGKALVAFAMVIGDNSVALVEAISKLLVALLDKIIELTPKFVEGFIVLVRGFLETITELSPEIIETFLTLLLTLLQKVADRTPEFVSAGISILTGFLEGVASEIPNVVAAAITIITNFLESLGQEVPKVVDAGFKMMIDFINGLATSIRENTPILKEALLELADAIIDSFFGMDTEFVNIGADIIQGLMNGIKSMATKAANAAKKVAEDVVNSVTNFLDIHSPSRVMTEIGAFTTEGFANGISDGATGAVDAAKNVASKVVTTVGTAIDQMREEAKKPIELSTEVTYRNTDNDRQEQQTQTSSRVEEETVINNGTTYSSRQQQPSTPTTKPIAAIKSEPLPDVSEYEAIVNDKINPALKVINEFKKNVTEETPKAAAAGKAMMETFIKTMVEAVKNNGNSLIRIHYQLRQAVMNTYDDMHYRFYTIGTDMIQGLIDGVNSMADKAAEAAKKVAEKLATETEKTLKIKSPSRRFFGIGKFTMKGLTNGISQNAKEAISAVQNVGETLTTTIVDSLDLVAKSMDSDMTIQPKLIPVLDTESMMNSISMAKTIDVSKDYNDVTTIETKNQNEPLLETLKNLLTNREPQEVDLNGMLTVEVTDDEGRIIGIAETAIKDLLRRESR